MKQASLHSTFSQANRLTALAVLLTMLVIGSGCQVSTRGFGFDTTAASGESIPSARTFWSLHRERNIPGRNDCSNKSGRYAEALQQQGIDARIVVVSHARERDFHAVVQTPDGMIYDPVNGRVGRDMAVFGEVKFMVTGQASTWGPEFR